MPIIPSGFIQVTHFFTGGSLIHGAAVTFAGQLSFLSDLQTIADDVHEAWQTTLLGSQTSDVVLSSTLVKAGPNDTGPFFEFVQPSAGTRGGDADAPQVSVLIEKVTGLGGRRGRGRIYMPGLSSVGVDDAGNLLTTEVTAIQNDADAYFAAFNAVAGITDMYLLHSESSPDTENPTPVPPPTQVLSLSVDPRTATQRRRLRR